MAETLGMLCDKLTIVKLKQYHTENKEKLKSLKTQGQQLQNEINEYITAAIAGNIKEEALSFASNKIFKKEGNTVADVMGDIGQVFYELADINCQLWHEQEKVYEFEKVPLEQKDAVVKSLALLNLKRNKCIDAINNQFIRLLNKK